MIRSNVLSDTCGQTASAQEKEADCRRPRVISKWRSVLEREPKGQTHVAGALEDLRQAVAASQGARRLLASKRSGSVERIHRIEAVHHQSPVHLRIASEARSTSWADQTGCKNVFIVGHAAAVIEYVRDVGLELQPIIFVGLTHGDLMTQREIGLEERGGTGVRGDVIELNVTVSQSHVVVELTSPSRPLARGAGSYDRQASGNRSALEGRLRKAKQRFLASPPLQPVVPIHLGGVRTIGCERAVVDLSGGQVGHVRKVKQAAVVRRVPTTLAIGRIGVGEARVVTGELAVSVGNRSEPASGGSLR